MSDKSDTLLGVAARAQVGADQLFDQQTGQHRPGLQHGEGAGPDRERQQQRRAGREQQQAGGEARRAAQRGDGTAEAGAEVARQPCR